MTKLHLPSPDSQAPKSIKIGNTEFKITAQTSTLNKAFNGSDTIRILRRAVKDGAFTTLGTLENERSTQAQY
jgi:hypothetical protein